MPYPRRSINLKSLITTSMQILIIALLLVAGSSCVVEKEAAQESKPPQKVVSSTDSTIKVGAAFRISQASSIGANRTDRTAKSASIAYNLEDNEYLVVWETDALTDAKGVHDIYGQRLNG